MTPAELVDLVEAWDMTTPSESPDEASRFTAILQRLKFFSKSEWRHYLPEEGPEGIQDYTTRLAAWIGNVSEEPDRQTLLEYASHISFFSEDDFIALYRTAFSGPITRWVIDQTGLRFGTPDFDRKLRHELLHHTWCCPVTDSMPINQFYKVNGIAGVDRRPHFDECAYLGDNPENIRTMRNYMSTAGLKRLVLLEDFVGSGDQVRPAIFWALRHLGVPVLFVPLIICPDGAIGYKRLEKIFQGTFRSSPVIELRPSEMLGPRRDRYQSMHSNLAEHIERLAEKSFMQVVGSPNHDPRNKPYSAFGYRTTGCSVVMYTNTPDNTLPLVHHRSPTGTWSPLFHRVSRV